MPAEDIELTEADGRILERYHAMIFAPLPGGAFVRLAEALTGPHVYRLPNPALSGEVGKYACDRLACCMGINSNRITVHKFAYYTPMDSSRVPSEAGTVFIESWFMLSIENHGVSDSIGVRNSEVRQPSLPDWVKWLDDKYELPATFEDTVREAVAYWERAGKQALERNHSLK